MCSMTDLRADDMQLEDNRTTSWSGRVMGGYAVIVFGLVAFSVVWSGLYRFKRAI